MTDRDDLIKIILADNVTYVEACRIADNIIDDGWASPEDLRIAKEYGFAEALDAVAEMHVQYRMENEDLLVEEFDQEKLNRVYQDMEVGGVTSYSQLNHHLASKWHDIMSTMIKDLPNPFKKLDGKKRKR